MPEQLFVVSCAEAGWESPPMTEEEALDLLDSPFLLHPFEGGCRTQHEVLPL
jgi:hypothetical protein